MVATAVHCTDSRRQRQHDRRRVSGRTPVHRLARELIKLRDRCCREPFCTAPIRHVDHIVPVRDGGRTSYDNGRGVCEHHNYLREMPGWQVSTVSRTGEPHATITTTPTGRHYLSRVPNPP